MDGRDDDAARQRRLKGELRQTLRCSQQEAVASATMTGTSDNFLNAFAVYLQASALQMGWLTAVPQLFGALFQILSVWLGSFVRRKPLVVRVAAVQAVVVAGMAGLALSVALGGATSRRVPGLIALAVLYFACLNTIQPHWRAWMGTLVPARRRGTFFAARTRLTMGASLAVFIAGGALLSWSDGLQRVWLGFALLFGMAAAGRAVSAWLLSNMHDPDPDTGLNAMQLLDSARHVRESLRDPTFRHYSFFVAAMQGAVAVSAPFFSVYMLRDLEFTYLQFALNNIASVGTQFVMLHFWGRFADRFGNHLLMVMSSTMITLIPLLWLISPRFEILILVQMLSGLTWSGFTLSTANYLYDIRPHQTNFALYAAIQSSTSALLVFCGALLGAYVVRHAPSLAAQLSAVWQPGNLLFLVFAASSLLRTAVVVGFVPRLKEPRMRRRPQILDVIFRVARFNAISGLSLDWMSVTRKPARRERSDRDEESPP